MLDGTLGTTNVLLAILAVVSVLEAVALAVIVIASVRLARHASDLTREVRQHVLVLSRRVDSLGASVESAVKDVKSVTTRISLSAERAQFAFDTIAGVAALATAGRASLAPHVSRLLGFGRGLRGIYRLFTQRSRPRQARNNERRDPEETLKEVVHAT